MDNRKLTIECPRCTKAASFEAAKTIQVRHKADFNYFRKSENFDFIDTASWGGRRNHYAVHFLGINVCLENIADIPEGYEAEKWIQPDHYRDILSDDRSGTVRCSDCHYLSKHKLNWPQEAYFQVEYKRKSLWAYDRQTAVLLKNYIKSTERRKMTLPASDHMSPYAFLHHVPEHFQTSKAREPIVKKLEKILGL